MILSKENLKNISKNIGGIYYIKNKINNKYYIGQSVNVYKRLLDHINKSKHTLSTSNQHIHRAINKDGIENFEFDILAYVNFDDINKVKSKLDFLEKYYIKKFNSFGKNGYNSTIGGDKGILGYKQKNEVIQRIQQTRSKQLYKKYNIECWCYNIETNKQYHLKHIFEVDNLISKEIRKSDILHYMESNKCNSICKFIFADTQENLQNKINQIEHRINSNNKKFTFKMLDYQIQKLRMAKSKYIYHQYDLNNNLIQTYYIKEIIDNFSLTFANNIRRYPIDKYVQINEYIWCKKLIHNQ